jgi:hypothetical protein
MNAVARPRLAVFSCNFFAAGEALPETSILNAAKCRFDHAKQSLFSVALSKQRFLLVDTGSVIDHIRLKFRSSYRSLLMVDTQAEFMLSHF